ncbi:hypothetical protein RT717_18600 [Imperialibacter roseus]|uniref:Methane oxygenase PmoA n=1 Tax=Imperialibacter roseus TaxID=1324217 RepID=A0ABZ0IM75_9BACT|nr:hypothetical protein [Imperialibacter roseus]WOK05095.1 hypothetical protein RT717_18600 [Imperialibacter roseus]
MKKLISIALVLVAGICYGQKKATVKVPMKPEHWEFAPGKVEFIEHKGQPSMKILPQAGFAVLKDMDFTNGTIEFDMETIDPNFASFYFHWQSQTENECFYLRTARIGYPTAKDAIQYAPFVGGVNLWDIMDHYQTNAVLKREEPNHIKLVVSGKQMMVYVNSNSPTLYVPMLEGNTTAGTIAFDSQVIISNLVVKHNETEGLSPLPGADPTDSDPYYIRAWQVSEPVAAGQSSLEFSPGYMPSDTTAWEAITAERRGLVNLTRKYGQSRPRRMVWLKTTINSASEQKKSIDLGFSDEVWVMINGRVLYVGANLYGHPIMKEPDGRLSLSNSSFEIPFQKGDNELLIGVANNFYGWGIAARFKDLNGLTLEK